MSIRGERLHAWFYGLFHPSDRELAESAFLEADREFLKAGIATTTERDALIRRLTAILRAEVEGVAAGFSLDEVTDIVRALFDFDELFVLEEPDWSQSRTTSEWWALRDQLQSQRDCARNFSTNCELVAETLAQLFGSVAAQLPTRSGPAAEGSITLSVQKRDILGAFPETVEHILAAFFDDEVSERSLFRRTRRRLERNLVIASGGNPDDATAVQRNVVPPGKSTLTDRAQLLATYLGGTPLTQLFEGAVPVTIAQAVRFEHHHIVAGSGHGKTQTLQYLIAHDLQQVVEQRASVIVIDSQGDLIRTIRQLEVVNEDNLVLVDPADVAFPVCLNLFDVQMERINSYSMLHREQMLNGILELYDFVLGSLLGAEMTQKQSVIFRYVTRLLLNIPDATIHTMLALFQEGGAAKYRQHILKLDGTARTFFETEFDSREFAQTKRQVVRRLYGILENQTFNRMFSHPRSKLDLYSEMNAGKLILINTAKDLLKETGSEILGRFFIAMITQAAQERATIPAQERMPTFVYVDEAQDYFDDNIEIILSQMRKQNVGLIAAHQYLDQLSPRLQAAFMANTSIKFAGGLSAKDARALAGEMRVPTEVLLGQAKGSFAASIRGTTRQAISLNFPFGYMEDMPRQSASRAEHVLAAMRSRFAVPYTEAEPSNSVPEAKVGMHSGDQSARTTESLDVPDISPSDKL